MGLVTRGVGCRGGSGSCDRGSLRRLWELRRVAGCNGRVVDVAAHLAYRLIAVGMDVLHGPCLAGKQGDQQHQCQRASCRGAAPARN